MQPSDKKKRLSWRCFRDVAKARGAIIMSGSLDRCINCWILPQFMFPFLLSLRFIFMIFHVFSNGFSCFHLCYFLVDLFHIYTHNLRSFDCVCALDVVLSSSICKRIEQFILSFLFWTSFQSLHVRKAGFSLVVPFPHTNQSFGEGGRIGARLVGWLRVTSRHHQHHHKPTCRECALYFSITLHDLSL